MLELIVSAKTRTSTRYTTHALGNNAIETNTIAGKPELSEIYDIQKQDSISQEWNALWVT